MNKKRILKVPRAATTYWCKDAMRIWHMLRGRSVGMFGFEEDALRRLCLMGGGYDMVLKLTHQNGMKSQLRVHLELYE